MSDVFISYKKAARRHRRRFDSNSSTNCHNGAVVAHILESHRHISTVRKRWRHLKRSQMSPRGGRGEWSVNLHWEFESSTRRCRWMELLKICVSVLTAHIVVDFVMRSNASINRYIEVSKCSCIFYVNCNKVGKDSDLVLQITTLFACHFIGYSKCQCAPCVWQYFSLVFSFLSQFVVAFVARHCLCCTHLHSVPAVVAKFALELQRIPVWQRAREIERERKKSKTEIVVDGILYPLSFY